MNRIKLSPAKGTLCSAQVEEREVEGREDEGLGTAGARGMEGDRGKRGNNTRIHNLPPPR